METTASSKSRDAYWNRIRTFEEYSEAAMKFAVYPNNPRLIMENGNTIALYPFFKLAGECGEVLEKIGKAIRDNQGVLDFEKREAMQRELGDVLWYVNACAQELGYPLGFVARRNIGKLAGRQQAGTLQGSGDNR